MINISVRSGLAYNTTKNLKPDPRLKVEFSKAENW